MSCGECFDTLSALQLIELAAVALMKDEAFPINMSKTQWNGFAAMF